MAMPITLTSAFFRRHLSTMAIAGGFLLLGLPPSANAVFISRLPATLGGSDYQAYYDTELDITWLANANYNNVSGNWSYLTGYANNLDIGGITGWRLPSMDVNGDGIIVNCSQTQTICLDNEFSYQYWRNGITPATPGPFIGLVQTNQYDQTGPSYWSSTELAGDPDQAWVYFPSIGASGATGYKQYNMNMWAVHSGDVAATVPLPATAWLFGSAIAMLFGFACRSRVS